jgi:hypothetical protein
MIIISSGLFFVQHKGHTTACLAFPVGFFIFEEANSTMKRFLHDYFLMIDKCT